MDSYTGRDLVFIIGCPRSGTTYLQKLLASHPRIHTGWESYVFAWYLGPMLRNWHEKEDPTAAIGEMRRVGLHSYLGEEEFRTLAIQFVRSMVGKNTEGQIFLEKTPAHSLWIPEIVELLPDARFINIIRDGRDVVASILAASKTWAKDSFTHHAFSAASLWSKYVRAVEKDRKLVAHGNFFDVRYEELRAEPAKHLTMLSTFLNLDWSEEEIRLAVERNDIHQAIKTGGTSIEPRQEAATRSGISYKYAESSFIRKGEPGSWKKDLKFYQKWQVWLFARNTLAQQGYLWGNKGRTLTKKGLPPPVAAEQISCPT